MKVTVIGGGSGGTACSVDLSLLGFDVMLYTRSEEKARLIGKKGIHYEGHLGEGEAKIKVTADLKTAAEHCQLVICTVPAYAQQETAERFAPFLGERHTVFLTPGTCGTLEFYKALSHKRKDDLPLMGETTTLPYGARFTYPNKVHVAVVVGRKNGILRVAAFPAERNRELLKIVGEIYRVKEAKNILETGLLNQNSIIHPPAVLLNLAAIERTNWRFPMYAEGYSDCVLHLIDSLDAEKQKVCEAYKIEPATVDIIRKEYGLGGVWGMTKRKGPSHGAQERFLDEDVPYGIGLIFSASRIASIRTPLCESFLRILSEATGKDYCRKVRRLERYGITKKFFPRIDSFLHHGKS